MDISEESISDSIDIDEDATIVDIDILQYRGEARVTLAGMETLNIPHDDMMDIMDLVEDVVDLRNATSSGTTVGQVAVQNREVVDIAVDPDFRN